MVSVANIVPFCGGTLEAAPGLPVEPLEIAHFDSDSSTSSDSISDD